MLPTISINGSFPSSGHESDSEFAERSASSGFSYDLRSTSNCETGSHFQLNDLNEPLSHQKDRFFSVSRMILIRCLT